MQWDTASGCPIGLAVTSAYTAWNGRPRAAGECETVAPRQLGVQGVRPRGVGEPRRYTVNRKFVAAIGAACAVLRAVRRWGVLGVVLALVTVTVGRVSAQNLVPNPSFEAYSSIPTGLALFDEVNLASFWSTPTNASPDYFHSLATGSSFVSVPGNVFGNQQPLTGQAYAGFHARTVDLYREYVETPLSSPLVAGQTYQVSFYVSLADECQWAVDKIDAYLSVGPVNTLYTLALTPQVSNPVGSFITDKAGWTAISGQYVAAGGEDHVVIGNFSDNPSTTPQTGQGGAYRWAYYYLDDVSVTPAATLCVRPPSGMVTWWPFEETSGITTLDIVGGRDGTALPGQIGGPGPLSVAGVVGNAFKFDGSSTFVEVPDGPGTLSFGNPTDNFSVDAWIQVNSQDKLGVLPIVDKRVRQGNNAFGYAFFLFDGRLAFQLADDLASGLTCGGGPPFPSSCTNYVSTVDVTGPLWHHVAVTVQRTWTPTPEVRLYVDGGLVLTGEARTGNANNNASLLIGTGYPIGISKPYFKGAIDELEIFNRVLTQQEILDIVNAGSAGKCKLCEKPYVAHHVVPYPPANPYVVTEECVKRDASSGSVVDIYSYRVRNLFSQPLCEFEVMNLTQAAPLLPYACPIGWTCAHTSSLFKWTANTVLYGIAPGGYLDFSVSVNGPTVDQWVGADVTPCGDHSYGVETTGPSPSK